MAADTRAMAALPGFGVLLDKELLDAQRSKRALVFLLIMTGCVLLVALIGYARADYYNEGFRHTVRDDTMEGIVGAWAALIAYLGSLMVIASTVDAMSHERSLGITAWIITKPVSRPSYLLAKAVAHTLSSLIVVVVVPSAVWLGLMVLFFNDVPVARALAAGAMLTVEIAFLSFAIVALGVPLKSVTPIALVSLAAWFLPYIVPAIGSLEWTYRVLPSFLPFAAIATAAGEPYESWMLSVPISAVCVGAVVFVTAIVLFERQEL